MFFLSVTYRFDEWQWDNSFWSTYSSSQSSPIVEYLGHSIYDGYGHLWITCITLSNNVNIVSFAYP